VNVSIKILDEFFRFARHFLGAPSLVLPHRSGTPDDGAAQVDARMCLAALMENSASRPLGVSNKNATGLPIKTSLARQMRALRYSPGPESADGGRGKGDDARSIDYKISNIAPSILTIRIMRPIQHELDHP
jgi:hypothetical protein